MMTLHLAADWHVCERGEQSSAKAVTPEKQPSTSANDAKLPDHIDMEFLFIRRLSKQIDND